jgi:hypothetical protein
MAKNMNKNRPVLRDPNNVRLHKGVDVRFSKVSLIGTLMAAAFSLLIILPVLAADGETNIGTSPRLNAAVFGNITDIAPDGTIDANQAILIDVSTVDPEDTKVGTTLYVGNSTTAFDYVLVTFKKAGTGGAAQTVDVKNATSGTTLTLSLVAATPAADGVHQAAFRVVASGASAGRDEITATDGQRIDVTDSEGTVISLTVDAEGPDITSITPSNKAIQKSTTVTYAAIITDSASGLRGDNEDPGQDGNSDDDADGITTAEPLAAASGAAVDINVYTQLATDGTDGSTDRSASATSGWTTVTDGYSFSFNQGAHAAQDHYFYVTATDRAGNTTRTDSDSDTSGDQNYKITVDSKKPTIDSATTGTGWDATDEEEESNNAAIKLVFKDTGAASTDAIDATSVAASDFVMDGVTISSVHVNGSEVYLHLDADLAGDAKPEFQMLAGAISDAAGNTNASQDITSTDGIAPTFTVTITGDAGTSRPVSEKKITVRVVSDETLKSAPKVHFMEFDTDTPTADKVEVNSVNADNSIKAVSGATNTWEQSYDASDMGITAAGAVVGIAVSGSDKNSSNIGKTTGFTDADSDGKPDNDEVVDMAKLSAANLIAEVDDNINAPSETLSPGGSTGETESTKPFIKLTYTESAEYFFEGSDSSVTLSDGSKVKSDASAKITITSITLDGVDVSGSLSVVDDETFNLATSGLALGEHTLKYTGEDAVGNSKAREFTFEVLERSAYKVPLSPGWNLVSFPGTPTDNTLTAVMGTNPAGTVLGYQNGEWLTASKSGSEWAGTLTKVEAGYGYWVNTTAFTAISTLIPEANPAAVLPTVPVTTGWNLLGVVDIALNAASTAVDGGDSSTYFSSIDWSVAYQFDTQGNAWVKSVSGTADNRIATARGYWVWANKAGTLVP